MFTKASKLSERERIEAGGERGAKGKKREKNENEGQGEEE